MKKRHTERIAAGYKAEIFYGNKRYPGIIENLSASGVNVLTDPLDSDIDFLPEDSIDLKFESPTGEEVILNCKIMWSSKMPPHNLRHRIGMEIIYPPLEKTAYFL